MGDRLTTLGLFFIKQVLHWNQCAASGEIQIFVKIPHLISKFDSVLILSYFFINVELQRSQYINIVGFAMTEKEQVSLH